MLDSANAEIEAGEKTLKAALKEYKTVCSAMSNPPSSDDEVPHTKRRQIPTPRVTQAKCSQCGRCGQCCGWLIQGEGKQAVIRFRSMFFLSTYCTIALQEGTKYMYYGQYYQCDARESHGSCDIRYGAHVHAYPYRLLLCKTLLIP